MFYSLFAFRVSYKIIVLSSLNIAGRGLTHLWPAGMGRVMGLKLAGRAWAKHSRFWSGLNSSLRAWAGLDSS